jgi:hypothetical protein
VTANGSTTYHFPAAGTDPVADGWTSATTLQSFGSSVVSFGAGHSYYVAYPPDRTGPDRRFRVSLVHGRTGAPRLVLRRRLCPHGAHPRLRGYDLAAGRSGAAVLAWRCAGRTGEVIDVQRIDRHQRLGRLVRIAQSQKRRIADRLSRPMTAFGAGSPTVLFSRAVTAARRDLLATSPTVSGRWRRPSVKARAIAARSAAALTAQLAWSPTGAALVTFRNGGFGGQIWAARRVPGAAFTRPVRLFPWSALTRFGSVAADGGALVLRVAPNRRLAVRAARG